MHRKLLALLIAAAPVAMILSLTTGCEDKVKTYKKTERVEESEPQMTSPGEEVLE